VENTNSVITEATIALNYSGDSILNSMSDVAAFAVGYTGAIVLPVRASVAAFLATEAVLLLTIHDSLLRNVLMLLHPVGAIKTWQIGR
jgi:hypothetical protein